MRIKKKELLEMIDQLIEINTLIDKDGRFPEGVDAPECQELALKLGNFIEDKYKESNPEDIIHSLEDYCELIYQMSLTENEEQTKLHKLVKKVKVVLLSARHGIEYDLPKDRKQVVFLPYKVSMWDSLESIWMAAHRDPEVDDYVIPIPYFDRNPDGTFAEMHYEGDQYPDYVPVTNWQEYSISDEKPEVIFIHNPYDKANYVTSVHPAFYSSELKKWTDCLVYVPYFVVNGTDASFFTNMGVYNSDYIVCTSEFVRKSYAETFNDRFGNKDYFEAFLPMGSPKYDKVRNLDISRICIPDEWNDLISRKKPENIVFFNTSVADFLNSDKSFYFERLAKTFNKLAENNYLIIWRPHPLFQATVDSLASELRDGYEKLLADFNRLGYGIIDTSPDMYPAIYLSDMYMGDGSSIVLLYMRTGKPLFQFVVGKDEILYYKQDKCTERLKKEIEKIFGTKCTDWEIELEEVPLNAGENTYKTILEKIGK